MSEAIWLLALSIAALQVADFFSTLEILRRGGRELNPLMRLLFSVLNVKAALLLTKGGVAIFVIFGAHAGWFTSKVGFISLLCLAAIYIAVAAHNLKQ